MENLKPSDITDFQPPESLPEAEIVECLFQLDKKTGGPFRFLVSAIPELKLMDILGATPIGAFPEPESGNALSETWAIFAPYASAIIEASCSPPVSFAEPAPAGAIPGKQLRDSERMALVVTALRVSGWTGGAAQAAARFLAQRSEPRPGPVAESGTEPPPRDGGVGTVGVVQDAAPAVGPGVLQPAEADAAGTG